MTAIILKPLKNLYVPSDGVRATAGCIRRKGSRNKMCVAEGKGERGTGGEGGCEMARDLRVVTAAQQLLSGRRCSRILAGLAKLVIQLG